MKIVAKDMNTGEVKLFSGKKDLAEAGFDPSTCYKVLNRTPSRDGKGNWNVRRTHGGHQFSWVDFDDE